MQDIEQLIRDAWKAGARHARTTPVSPDSEALEAHLKEALAPRIPLSVSWEFIRDEYRFAAQQPDGTILVGTEEPFEGAGMWIWTDDASVASVSAIKGTIKSTLPWRETLIERPGVEVAASEPVLPHPPALDIDWAQVPEEFGYAAMDEDGAVFAYQDRPVIGGHAWFAPLGKDVFFIATSRRGSTSPIWTKSLTARPKTQ